MAEKPKENIGYLLAHTCKAHRGLADRLFTEVGLHVGQDMILFRLWCEDGLTQSELVEQLCVQPATITKMLHRLVQAGLVERRSDPDDQRLSRVFLTDRGWSLQRAVEEIWDRLEQCAFASLTLEERLLLRRLLMQVHDNITKSA